MKKIASVALIIAGLLLGLGATRGETWKVYADPRGFQIRYPASWVLSSPKDKAGVVELRPPGKATIQLKIRQGEKSTALAGLPLNDFADQLCLPQIKKNKGVDILEKWKFRTGGGEARTILYTFMAASKMRFKEYVFFNQNKYYWLTFGGRDDIFSEYSTAAEMIITSLKIPAG